MARKTAKAAEVVEEVKPVVAVVAEADGEKSLSDLRSDAADLMRQLNIMYREGGDFKVVTETKERLNKVIAAYSSKKKHECYEEIVKKGGNYLLNAIFQDSYQTLTTKKEEVGNGDNVRTVLSLNEEKDAKIDVYDFYKWCKQKYPEIQIGADPNWDLYIQRFNRFMAIGAIIDKNIDNEIKMNAELRKLDDSYKMKKEAQELIDKRFEHNNKAVLTNTEVLKRLNIVVQAMLGKEYKAISHDAAHILQVYTTDNKKGERGVKTAKHQEMRKYVTDVCYRIITKGRFITKYPGYKA